MMQTLFLELTKREKAQKGKSEISEILQEKGTELVVRGDKDLSELGSASNAMAAKHGIELTLKVSVKKHMHFECVCISLNFLDFSSKRYYIPQTERKKNRPKEREETAQGQSSVKVTAQTVIVRSENPEIRPYRYREEIDDQLKLIADFGIERHGCISGFTAREVSGQNSLWP